VCFLPDSRWLVVNREERERTLTTTCNWKRGNACPMLFPIKTKAPVVFEGNKLPLESNWFSLYTRRRETLKERFGLRIAVVVVVGSAVVIANEPQEGI
jgi:hypothetical protein